MNKLSNWEIKYISITVVVGGGDGGDDDNDDDADVKTNRMDYRMTTHAQQNGLRYWGWLG